MQNCTLAAHSMMLKATDLGLSTCYIGVFDSEAISRILRLPDTVKPLIILTLGYADEIPRKKHIFSIDKLTKFNSFDNKKRPKELI